MNQYYNYKKWLLEKNKKVRLATFPHPLPSLEEDVHGNSYEPPSDREPLLSVAQGIPRGFILDASRHNPGYTSYSILPEGEGPSYNPENMPRTNIEVKDDNELRHKTSKLLKGLFEGHAGIIPHINELDQGIIGNSATAASENRPLTYRYLRPDQTTPLESHWDNIRIEDEPSLKELSKRIFSYIFNSGLRHNWGKGEEGTSIPRYVIRDILRENSPTDNLLTKEEISSHQHIPKYHTDNRANHNLSEEDTQTIDHLTHEHSKLLEPYIEHVLSTPEGEKHETLPEFILKRHPNPLLAKYLHDTLKGQVQ